ncbi:MAG: hypothetical protein QOH31_3822 [Verrucomicrobiota bacterium]|jgi:hypothetical protein
MKSVVETRPKWVFLQVKPFAKPSLFGHARQSADQSEKISFGKNDTSHPLVQFR